MAIQVLLIFLGQLFSRASIDLSANILSSMSASFIALNTCSITIDSPSAFAFATSLIDSASPCALSILDCLSLQPLLS